MSTGWSLYISVLTLGTLAAMGWLLWAGTRPPEHHEPLSWDGIEEEDYPPPRWWVWLFIATLVFAVLYLVLYPGLGNWRGLLPGYEQASTGTPFSDGRQGWSAVHEWEQANAQANAQLAPWLAQLAAKPITELAKDPAALRMGERLFAERCAQCHGSDAGGGPGYPNLTDSDWRWGGSPEQIHTTIFKGRRGAMPPWQAVLGDQGVADVAAYVLQLGNRPLPAEASADASRGQALYARTCIACHGPQGKGQPLLGAPDLTHPGAFIYGSGFDAIRQSIALGRQGQMPAQGAALGDERVKVLAAYVWQLSQEPAP